MQNVYIKKPHHKQEKEYSCIPACVRMVLDFYGISIKESELRLKLKTRTFGSHAINILQINDEDYGIKAKIDFWSLEQLKLYLEEYKMPCIVTVWTEFFANWDSECLHTVVVCGFDDKHIIINDPFWEEKELYVPIDNFINAWQINDGLVMVFEKSA